MHLVRLRIDTLPGIEPGFIFEAPGNRVNLVTGPNAVGKSSLVRALGYVLRGARKGDPPALSLSAEFRHDETRWNVRRSGSQVLWTRNGETVAAPSLPGADQIGLCLLSVDSLLAGETTDDELAAELQRSLRGGFDLDAPRVRISRNIGRAEKKALSTARRALAEVETKYEHLRRQETELPGLAQQISKAESAREECSRLHTAMRLCKAAEQRKKCEYNLAEFPAALGSLKGDEVDRVSGLDAEVVNLRNNLRLEEEKLASANEDHRRTGLQDSCPTTEEVEVIGKCLQRMSLDLAKRATARTALANAESAVQRAVVEFDGTGQIPRLDPDSLRRGEEIAEPLIAARARRKELEQLIVMSGEAPEEPEIQRLQSGVNALRTWLTDVSGAGRGVLTASRGFRLTLWTALVGAAIAVLMAFLERAFAAVGGAAAAMVASVAALILLYRHSHAARPVSERARREFEESGLEPPGTWSTSAVREHLSSEVESRLNELLLQRERAGRVKQLQVQLEEVATEENALEAKRKSFGAELGFDPSMPLTGLNRFLRLCVQLEDARSRRDDCRTELEQIDRDIASVGKRISDFLDRWRLDEEPSALADGAGLEGDLLQILFDGLRKRLADAASARNRIRIGDAEIRSLRKRLGEAKDEIRGLFEDVGLRIGDRESLTRLIEKREPWQDARSAVDQARGYERQLREQLGEHPELVQLANGDRTSELQALLGVAKVQADEYTTLVERRTEIETRLDEAGSESRLEKVLAGVRRAREALAEKLDEALHHDAAELLLDDVEAAFKSQHEPQVLRRARALFSEATGYAFTLELDEDGFRSDDKRLNCRRSLGELSSGTRMQLLLSLRLAWTEAREQDGESLPLFLDEALTTSDENRFKVMANSLERLAEAQDRQIFYLTARMQDAALWQDVTGRRPPVVDLAQVRFAQQTRTAENYRVERPPPLPGPKHSSAEDYAVRLGVTPFDPRVPEGTTHLFYLLRDDLDLLYRLMSRWHIESVGQLEQLLNSSAASGAVSDAVVRDRLVQRCRTIRTWSNLWRQGRGRAIDRGTLEKCGAVSGVFIDRVTDLAQKLGGEGAALVEALRRRQVSRFPTGKIDDLERWLLAEGFTDERDTLSAEERRRLVLQQTAPETDAAATDTNAVVTWLEAAL
ncbi:MAG: hypothetical protein OXP09_19650 [Gammaproteobacteria bacterium]|nr:hypothetical protein [Gammaproteobacteria bacterium]MDE0367776.1 hypothetical protein [Gammaproteobacteria bacterium]